MNLWALYGIAVWIVVVVDAISIKDFVLERRTSFERRFQDSCAIYYPFVQSYQQLTPPLDHKKYLIFVFHESGQKAGAGGGLGDRLGGMLTAFSYALRTNRTFLIEGDAPLSNLFQPHINLNNNGNTTFNSTSWGDWSWSGWQKSFNTEAQKLHCVNPRPKHLYCALDDDSAHSTVKVLKYYGNRSYLCRWVSQTHPSVMESLRTALGIDSSTNLYHTAGCLLRLILWPTEHMWQSIESFYQGIIANSTSLSSNMNLYGVHFRCGDTSFSANKDSIPNPQCFYNSSIPWQGTMFSDDKSMDSPIDLAKCTNKLMISISNQSIVYAASDNFASAIQIVNHLNTRNILLPSGSCHIDLQQNCAETTLVQWFALSLADRIITQALIPPPESGYTDPQRNDNIHAPISAFSKYAFIYSLSTKYLLYGNCTDVDSDQVARHTHGNWVCTPRTFFRE